MSDKVSIIIPSFNHGKKLRELLMSIQEQSYSTLEVLLIDGGSTDNTKEVANEFNSLIDLFISEKDQGIYHAMNKGIARSTGDWLYFIGCDDTFYGPDVLKNVFSKTNKHTDLIYGKIFNKVKSKAEGQEIKHLKDLLSISIWHQAVFYRKELFEKFGSYELKYKIAADVVFNLSVFSSEEVTCSFVDKIICNFSGDGISTMQIDPIYHAQQKELYFKWFASLPESEIYDGLQHHLYNEIKSGSLTFAFFKFIQLVLKTAKFHPYIKNSAYFLRKRIFS